MFFLYLRQSKAFQCHAFERNEDKRQSLYQMWSAVPEESNPSPSAYVLVATEGGERGRRPSRRGIGTRSVQGVSLVSITRFVNEKFVPNIENKINLIVNENTLTVCICNKISDGRPPAIDSSLIHTELRSWVKCWTSWTIHEQIESDFWNYIWIKWWV